MPSIRIHGSDSYTSVSDVKGGGALVAFRRNRGIGNVLAGEAVRILRGELKLECALRDPEKPQEGVFFPNVDAKTVYDGMLRVRFFESRRRGGPNPGGHGNSEWGRG